MKAILLKKPIPFYRLLQHEHHDALYKQREKNAALL